MKNIKLLIILLLMGQGLWAQVKIIGTVLNKESNIPIINATIRLNSKLYTTSNKKGRFEFTIPPTDSILLKITHIGFKKFMQSYFLPKAKKKIYLPLLKMIPDQIELGEVKIKGKGVLETIKGDTLEYNVRLLKMDKYDTAKELVEAIPGVYRNKKGKLIAKNKVVKIVTVDGRYLYRNEVDKNLEALPADIIAKVQIYDDYDELSKFSGFPLDNVNNSAINLVTKYPNLTLALGNYFAYGGDKDRYKLYGNNTFLLKKSNININEKISNFPNIDHSSRTDGFPKNYTIKKLESSYANQDSKLNVFVDGRYSVVDKLKEGTVLTHYYNEERENRSENKNEAHIIQSNLNTAFDLRINKKNKLFFENNYSELDSENKIQREQKQFFQDQEILNSNYLTNSTSNTKTIRTHLVSRSLLSPQTFLELSVISDYTINESFLKNKGIINNEAKEEDQRIEQKDHKLILKPKFILYKNSDHIYRFNHELVYQKSDLDDEMNIYNINYLANTFNISSSFSSKYFRMTYSMGYRVVESVDSPLNVNYKSLVGHINTDTKIGKYTLSLNYSRKTNTPKINQLFNFYDSKNPFYIRLGNTKLKQAEVNCFSFNFDFIKRTKLQYNIKYEFTNNYIVNTNTLVQNGNYNGKDYANGTLINQYKNTNGYKSIGLSSTFNFPIIVSLFYDFSYVPNFYNDKKNISKSNKYSLSLSWSYYRNKYFSVDISSNNDYSQVNNSISIMPSNYFYSNNKLKLILKKIWGSSIRIEYCNLINYYKIKKSETYIKNFIDLSIRKPILKSKFDLSFVVKDLLNNGQTKQNKITQDYLREVNSNLESRMFLVKLSYKFCNKPSTNYNLLRRKVNSVDKKVAF